MRRKTDYDGKCFLEIARVGGINLAVFKCLEMSGTLRQIKERTRELPELYA